MDLEQKIKSYPKLSSCLADIIKSCERIWNNPLLPWFTKHDVSHSKEVIHLLGQILSPLEDTPQMLNEHELFILLASAYLHDIGMQNLKVDNISIDKLTPEEYELIRKRHAEESFNIILKRFNKPMERDDFHLPVIEDDYVPIIARVSKGHATDFFEESIDFFEKNPAKPLNRTVRAELLTALLMIADELDLQSKRAGFFETAKFNLSDYSAVHWYKHHYVASVEVDKGTVCLTLQFPEDANEYEGLIKELIETKLKTQIEKIYPILNESTEGLLHLNNIKIQTQVDSTGTKRKLPDGALKELKKILKEPEPAVSDIKDMEDIISHSIPRPSPIFTGREVELKRFKEALEQSNLISIEGLGGIGKSEFAAKCVEEYLQHGKSVWFDCSPDTKLDSLIDFCGYSDVIKGENKTELAKYSGFLSLVERDGKTIFLDNYQDITDESFRSFFKFSERRLRKARFVLIAREHPALGSIHILPVTLEGLKKYSVEYARKVINMFYSDVAVDDNSLQNICDTVDGHPLAIDLAIQLLHYGEASREIIDKLVHSKDINEELSHRLLDEIFSHPKSTEQEKEFLLNFSIFRNKVFSKAFEYISDDPDRMTILRKLMDKHMIMHYGKLYGVHPLVREFCYHRLKNKEKLHLKAYEYLKGIRQKKLSIILEEEVFYHLLNGEQLQELANLISEKGEDFILLGHANFLKEMMDAIVKKGIEQAVFYLYYGNIAQIRGEWDDATKYFEKSFSFPSVDEKTNAMAYIMYGEILFRKGQVKESLEYFQKGVDNCKKINFRKGEARSLNDIGLVSDKRGDLNSAMLKHKESLKIGEEIGDKKGIAISLNNMGLVLGKGGDLNSAMSKHKESLKIREEIGDKSGIANSLNNIGGVLREKGDLDGAMSKYKESLKINEEIGDKSGIAHPLNNIGGVLDVRGDFKGAMSKYKECLKINEEIGDKEGVAVSLNNIGSVLGVRGDLNGAMSKYKESLKIREEIGDKSGIAISLNNIGGVLREKGDLDGAMSKYKESLKIREEVGNKSGIAISLHNIGFVLREKEDLEGAMSKYKESLKISEEIGDKSSITTTLHNIGTLCFEKKNYHLALMNLFRLIALENQTGIKKRDTYSYILQIRKIQGFKKFKNLAEETFGKLPEDLKPFINTKEFTEDKIIHVTKKPERNAPCPCGSGKKYKKCCGRSK